MALSTAAKVGTAGTITTGSGITGLYLARDHINYYEVERKVMDENVEFDIGEKTSDGNWKIKIKTATDGPWKENDGYYWECDVSGTTTPEITKTDLEVRLFDIFGGNTKETRRRLINVCSRGREEKTHNKVKSKIVFGQGHASGDWNKNNWDEYLFGSSILGETEKEALKDDVYFEITDKQNETPLKIKAKSSDTDKWKDDGGYSWQCTFPTTATDITKSDLDTKLPQQSNIDDKKKANKKRLIYLCSKYKTKESSGKQITSAVSYDGVGLSSKLAFVS